MKFLLGIGAAVLAVVTAGLAMTTMDSDRSLASFGTSLAGRTKSQRHNSTLALSRLKGANIEPGEVFSFNRRVGSFSQDQGYRRAPVSYNGQLISDWGGGVCQTSTTLYNTALLAGMKIVERHRHRFAPGYVAPGRDAAVAFSNIDLKFKNPYSFPVRIEGDIEGDMIVLSIVGPRDIGARPQIVSQLRQDADFQTFRIGNPHGEARVRNTGKEGCSVAVYRITGDRRELVSMDTYPAMNRVIQYR